MTAAAEWWRFALSPSTAVPPPSPSRAVREEALREAWERASRDFFDGALPPRVVTFEVIGPRSRVAVTATHVRVAAHLGRDWRAALAALLFAAVRMYAADAQQRGMGRRFCDTANAVGARIGAVAVVPRGQGDANPYEWPTVRDPSGIAALDLGAILAERQTLTSELAAARAQLAATEAVTSVVNGMCAATRDAAQRAKRRAARAAKRRESEAAASAARELEALARRLARLPLPSTARALLGAAPLPRH